MVEHVLVAIDDSPMSDRALDHALETFPDATVTVLHVIDPVGSVSAAEGGGIVIAEQWYQNAEERAESICAEAVKRVGEREPPVETAVEVGRPARTIVDYSDEHDVDHIVMGSHGRKGLDRLLTGSVAEHVVRHASVPVTVVR